MLVCDLASRTGTFRNNEPVRVGPLSSGDCLRVGSVEVVLELEGRGTAGATKSPTSGLGPVDTPPRLTVAGQVIDLTPGAALVGRRSTCALVVDAPDTSLAHALLFVCAGRPAVFDLGSRSGTFLNGQRVQSAWLHDGDCLTIGGQRLTVACDVAPREHYPASELRSAQLPVGGQPDGLPPNRPAAPDPAGEGSAERRLYRILIRELAARQQELDRRAEELRQREAEQETLMMLLGLERTHLESMRAATSKQAAEVAQQERQLRARLAMALKHEQALTAAWKELERWRATLEARYRLVRGQGEAAAPPATADGAPLGPAQAPVVPGGFSPSHAPPTAV